MENGFVDKIDQLRTNEKVSQSIVEFMQYLDLSTFYCVVVV